jgi:protein SCO1/2
MIPAALGRARAPACPAGLIGPAWLRQMGVLLLGLMLAGCGLPKPAFKNTDVTGADCCKDFRLTDHNGKVRTLADFRGKAVVVFFGYTQCPDVCPTTMAEMKAVLQQLGPDAQRVQVLFVTLDPERDTRELLANYVPAFDPSFLGLYGDLATTAKTAQEFRVFYQKQPGPTPGSYTLDHTAGSYVFDPQGRVRLFVRHGDGGANLVADLRELLKQD